LHSSPRRRERRVRRATGRRAPSSRVARTNRRGEKFQADDQVRTSPGTIPTWQGGQDRENPGVGSAKCGARLTGLLVDL
jgi:hypothetical protein